MLNKEIIYDNNYDVYLLMNNPNDLIVKYQYLVELFIKRYVSSGHIESHQKDDIRQSVNEDLLNKIDTLQKQYNNKSLLRTNMSVVIGNLCYDKVYKHKRSLVRVDIKDEAIHSGQEDILTGIILENEFDRLKKILILYNKQQKKIEFILKVYFRCPVSRKDFLELSDKLSDEDFERFDNNIDIKKLHTDKIIFEFITPILNKIDNKNNASDAVRKWVRLKIDEIIELINGTPARTNYTKETLQILMEKFFAKNC